MFPMPEPQLQPLTSILMILLTLEALKSQHKFCFLGEAVLMPPGETKCASVWYERYNNTTIGLTYFSPQDDIGIQVLIQDW